MKKIGLLSLCFATMYASAQNIKVEAGKVIKVTSSTNTSGESPAGGESKNVVITTSSIKIGTADDKSYKATTSITRMQMDGEMMGQAIKFDSDKKEDMDSQIGQMLGGTVNKTTEVSIDKTTGKLTETKKSEESGMGGMPGSGNTLGGIFLAIGETKKVGDKWNETTEDDGLKTIKNYELQSIKENIATVMYSSTTKGTTTKETNGMSMEMTMDKKENGTILVDLKTGVVKEMNNTSETTGSMEVMGQSIPLNNKSTTKVTVE
jgi:Family of unknown function (DUF6263)